MVNPFIQQTLDQFFYLLKAPLIEPEMWWIISPLIIILILMTFYFGKYIREKLGWNTALGNCVVLLFVGIDLLRTMYNYSIPPTIVNYALHPVKTLVIFAVMIEAIFLAVTAYRHTIPRKIMFFVAAPLPVNLQAYVLTVVVYTGIRPTWHTLFAAILLFVVLFVILRTIQEIEHLSYGYHFKKKRK